METIFWIALIAAGLHLNGYIWSGYATKGRIHHTDIRDRNGYLWSLFVSFWIWAFVTSFPRCG